MGILKKLSGKITFPFAVKKARKKLIRYFEPLIDKLDELPLVNEDDARNCGEVYHDGHDLFCKPFDGQILTKLDVLNYLTEKIIRDDNKYIYANDWEPSVREVNSFLETKIIGYVESGIANASMQGSVFVLPQKFPDYYEFRFCVVRVKQDGYLCYRGTFTIRSDAGEQTRIPVIG